MSICLVPDIPNQQIIRSIEDIMQRDRQLRHAKARAKMAFLHRDDIDDEIAKFRGQLRELIHGKKPQIGWAVDMGKEVFRHQSKVRAEVVFLAHGTHFHRRLLYAESAHGGADSL